MAKARQHRFRARKPLKLTKVGVAKHKVGGIAAPPTVYRVDQKEVHRDNRLVRLNGTCQIYDFLHKGNTEGGKTDASELGARQCEISRKIRFASRHAFWPHHCRKLGGDSC